MKNLYDHSPIHRDIATKLIDFGGLLRCTTCGHESGLSEGAIARYMANGWPKHCGYTMRWITARELNDKTLASGE